MSNGNPILYNGDVVNYDPRVTATSGQRGSVLKYAPTVGAPVFLQKQDDGETTNWTALGGGGGGSVTGLPNTWAFFNALGGIDSVATFVADAVSPHAGFYSGAVIAFAPGSFAFVTGDGAKSVGQSSLIFGDVNATSSLSTSGIAGLAHARQLGGSVDAGEGSHVHGITNGNFSSLSAVEHSHAFGTASGNGSISAANQSLAYGAAQDSQILSQSSSLVQAQASNASAVSATGVASRFQGASRDGSTVTIDGEASSGAARVRGGSSLLISARASSFMGDIDTGGIVNINGSLSAGIGLVDDGAQLLMSGPYNKFLGILTSGSVLDLSGSASSFQGQLLDGSNLTLSGTSLTFNATISTAATVNLGGIGCSFNGSIDSGTFTNIGSGSNANFVMIGASTLAIQGDACNVSCAIAGGSSVQIDAQANCVYGVVDGLSNLNIQAAAGKFRGSIAGGSTVLVQDIASINGSILNAAVVRILAGASGSSINGYFDGGAVDIDQALGAHVFGAMAGGLITVNASATGAFVIGANHVANAAYSFISGQGHQSDSFSETVVGQFSEVEAGNPSAYVSTDAAHRVGGGANSGSLFTAHRIDKDGRVTTRASHRDRAVRIQSGAGAISGRTDYMILVNLATAGASSLELPAPEDGLRFKFGSSGAGATSNYTLDAVTNGGTLDAGVPDVTNLTVVNYIEIVALGGVWYRVA